jgi:predicted PurR-regulated permease PerM
VGSVAEDSVATAGGEEESAPVIPAPANIRSVSLTVLAVVAAVFTLQHGRDFFIPLVLSVLVSYALEPVVSWLTRLRVPRALAAAIVLLMIVGGVGWGIYSLRIQATAIVNDIPQAAQRLRNSLRNERAATTSTIQQVQEAATEIERTANEAAVPAVAPRGVMRVQIEEPPIRVRDYLWWGSTGIVAVAGQLVAVLFLVYFLLVSGDLFKRKLVKVTGPTLTKKKITVQILDEINVQIERFLAVQLFASALVGIASWLAFESLGLEQAAVWGLVAGLFNSIPYFGPVVVTGGIAVIALLQFGTLSMVLLVSAVALAITSLEGFLLTPWLTGRAAQMNPVAIFVGLLFWTWVWGVWGTLLAVPMLMVVKAVCERVEDVQPIAELLGD